MKLYYLTAYSKTGEHLINETLEAETDKEAIENAVKRLEEENLQELPSRLVKSSGGMLHFHP
ncbi:YhzD family protein [Alkalicoccus daliensis]|uniref:YhzD-like protein n=1 Tax=Alkalicoccus daliensis TaxID=745820 RepID=A0A1H0IEP3_9BACI|nr:YhzD family protein [Alkalicoccus daliensis]SDO29868.1 YhzD-like protein [Alkalicoccus daliensis]